MEEVARKKTERARKEKELANYYAQKAAEDERDRERGLGSLGGY